ncbi:MAG: undecaprenyldiphospho-muramoylpentapeptide beta-N-acetylglucosaminyltransferase [Campylobacterota bacterium]|nr:undecaprenyldiphospho-muramoylpentapeptide beta-N-acetylglucosaminyltransferase [Campylobacterota bacterium]
MNKYIIVTGGGTGGHLSVAKAFINELNTQGYKVIFIGSTKGQDKKWFENEPSLYKAFFLKTQGVVNQKLFGKIYSLWLILKAVLKSIQIIKKYKVSKVISVGGFSAASASFASIITKTDFYIHEQNSVMGKLNKLTSKYAKEVFSSYLDTSKVKDYPIREEFFTKQRVRTNIKTIIFLGGSQGAKAINEYVIEVAPTLNNLGIKIIHQTGKDELKSIEEKYKTLNIDADVFDFSNNLIDKMQKADFAVSRSGASTLWELVALGIPTLFIPYPYAASNHQYYNAKYLLDNDLCFLKTQKELYPKYLTTLLDNQHLNKISQNLIKTIHPNAVHNIIKIIMN